MFISIVRGVLTQGVYLGNSFFLINEFYRSPLKLKQITQWFFAPIMQFVLVFFGGLCPEEEGPQEGLLLLMSVLAQALLTLVRGHLVTFVLFTVRHDYNYLMD